MKKIFTYVGLIIGSFFIGFLTFYFLMPVISAHSRTVDVPYLKHMTIKESRDFLKSLGLKSEIQDSVYSREVESGRVIETIPSKKEEVRIGSVIKLIVSKGPGKIRLPSIIGLSREKAIDSLDHYGITNRVIINIPVKEKGRDGTIIKTRPSIEDSLEKGGKLTIFIGKEKREVFLMPNLIGLPLSEAKEILADYELELAPIKRVKSVKEEVLLQTPLAGVEVTLGDTIRLVVGQK
ncbi:PASTA domain-containing protein [candidate division WOR-3 bacterium]|jgi:serine/threonine-protein kinase|nr:PASTA domain-containing protein [candidate division WOR-3 bacterium]